MNLSSLSDRALGTVEMFAKRHGSTILTSAGVTGFVATTILVGRAVLKSQPVVAAIKEESQEIGQKEITEAYTKRHQAQEWAQLYMHGSGDLVKYYGPAVAVGIASIACVIAGHGMAQKKQAALLAAYTTLDNGFKAYRARIRQELGDDKELEVYRGIKGTHQVELADGVTIDVREYADIIPSEYAKFFDECSSSWSKTPEYNLMFLRSQQQWANDKLNNVGFLFLNEVYEALGLPRTQAGQIVGWKKNGKGDGYVDFGMYDADNEITRAFVNGAERVILLDFNVDGPITIGK